MSPWSDPPLYSATLQTVTAFNAYIRANLIALKDPPSGLSYVSGRDYQIAGLGAFTAVDTALVDGVFQHSIALAGSVAKVSFLGSVFPKVNNGQVVFNIAVNGVDYFPAPGIGMYDTTGMSANVIPLAFNLILTGLTPGSNQFRLDWSGTHTAIQLNCTGASGAPAMFYVTEAR